MKAIRLHSYHVPEGLSYEEAPTPVINPDQVLVRIYATSVNHLEVAIAQDKMQGSMPVTLPWIPGFDLAGVVEKTGENVRDFTPGQEVYAKTTGGTYTEYIALSPSDLAPRPSTLSFVESASVPHVGLTAWQALYEHGQLQSGQKVLIHGAAGGVGSFAVQFAKNSGAFVYATASARDRSFLSHLHADEFIDYKNEDFTTIVRDADLVIDLVGGETQLQSYHVLKENGRLVTTTGPAKGGDKPAHITFIPMVVHPDGNALRAIATRIEQRKVICDIAQVYSLEQTKQAWATFLHQTPESRTFTHGKIILNIHP